MLIPISDNNVPAIECDIEAKYPLMAMESGLVFHALYDDRSSDYLSQGEHLLYNIDPQQFWKAWQQAIQHYQTLRSCFVADGSGVMQQVVSARVASAIHMINFSTLSPQQSEAAYQKIVQQEIHTPFDLSNPPLMRLVLCQMSQQEYRLIWTHHHLLLDLRSAFHVLNDVMRYYDAIHHHQPVNLPPTVSKGEILANLPHIETDQAQAYWRERLKDYAGTNALPFAGLTKQIAGSTESFTQNFFLEKTRYIELKQFARKHRLTPSLIVHVAWGLTLCSYLNSNDIVFGTVRSLPYALIKNSAGLFINNLPIRIRFDRQSSVLDCLNDAREQYHQLKRYWNSALNDVKQWIGLSPHQNLFNSCISFSTEQSNTLIEKHLAQLQFKFRSYTHYPLMLECFVHQDGLLNRLTAQTGLFSEQMIAQLCQQFFTHIQQIIKNPHKKISELSLLSLKNYQQFNDWNKTVADFPQQTLTVLLEEQILNTPEQIAVHFENKQLSYRQLNIQANKLAHWLREQGARPNTTIAIYMERCLELMIALLGVIKSGAAYLPFDPNIPLSRLTDIVITSQTAILLTSIKYKKLLLTIPKLNNLSVVYVDQEQAFHGYSIENPSHINTPNDDLYVMYTSGSTGKPKGVRNHHLGIVNQLNWMQKNIPLQAEDRVLQKTTLGFDVSVWEFFWPWLAGAQVVLAPADAQYDFNQLVDIINQKKVTTIQFVPTQLDSFVQNINANICYSIRYILSIGEALKQTTVINCLDLWPQVKLYNLYGPTETSIASSYYLCSKHENYTQVPIGKPIDNTQLLVLNDNQQLVPPGGIGELYIGGVGVAKGYIHQPELTDKCFIKNPLRNLVDTAQSPILYKTGDLVTWSLEGELHFIGRRDNQVKRHGIRIELSEIEHQLLQQHGIKQCVVILQKNQHEYLVAYCVATDSALSTASLQKALAQYLPDYMIPTHFIWLDSLPLLMNGKLDRAALPAIKHQEVSVKISSDANNSISQKLQIIWQEVLKLNSIALNDNLFTIGGDSISVIQITNKARAQGIDIKPKWIFDHPTIASLNKLISQQSDTLALINDVPNMCDQAAKKFINPSIEYKGIDISAEVKSYGVEDVYSLSPIQQGILFHSITTSQDPYICQYSFNLLGNLNLGQFRSAWKKLMTHYDMLRTGFFADDKGRYSQIVFNDCPLPIQIIDLSGQSPVKQHRYLKNITQKDRHRPFSVNKPPLFRITVLVLAENEYRCLLSLHHIIHDAWSISLLFETLCKLYNHHIDSLENYLSEQSKHYKDFVIQHAKKDEKAGIYWKKLLHGFDTVLHLDICSQYMVSKRSRQYSNHRLNLSNLLCEKLTAFAKTYQTTVNIVMQSAWAILLNRYSHQQDIVYGTVLSGRTLDLPDIDRRFGLFLQTIPIRVKLTSSLTVDELMQQLNTQFSVNAEYADYPLSDIQSDHFDGEKKSLFDYLIIFENYPSSIDMKNSLTDLVISDINIHAMTHYPISLLVMTEPSIQFNLFYDSSFTYLTIKKFLVDLRTILEQIVKNPKQSVNKLSLLSEKQTKHLLAFSESKTVIANKYISLYELFYHQALKHPQKTAIVFQNSRLTYAQLNDAVSRVSSVFSGKSGEVIALYFSQHPDFIISILALLRMGCTYLTIDPKSSEKYVQRICSENHIKTILTDEALNLNIADIVKQQKIDIITVSHILKNTLTIIQPVQPININHHIAYIIYTSGSTGQTKGVAISQSSVINLLLGINNDIQFQSVDCFLAATAYTFDISVIEWLLPLVMGGTSILVSPERLADDDYLNQLSYGYPQVFIQATPSMWDSILKKSHWKINPPLNIIAGGEALGNELAIKLLKKSSHVWNCYGPTETTIWSTIYPVTQPNQPHSYHSVPIGKPLANTRTYVLNENLSLCPIGISGELYIGGSGVMQGYIGEAGQALNQQKLIPSPFHTDETLYKTGDKVCWLADGNLQFLGRFDDQVKIRGFRVDLDQIAAVLETHDLVKKAIVLIQQRQTDHRSLMAYVLLADTYALADNQQIGQTHCDQWGVIYDRWYQQSQQQTTFDTTGWISSYTGKPLSTADMQEWVKNSVDRIITLAPKKILEIGCGMGLLLFPIAPSCQSYHGTDIAATALSHITEQLKDKPFKDKISLSQCSADQLNFTTHSGYDTSILNSVIQYFPHIYYLVDVLERCMTAISTGGQLFIGDVRSFIHLQHFHASVALHQTAPSISLVTLKQQFFKHLHQEKELVVDPSFFIHYAQHHPRISHVDIQLKTGAAENEMNDYRYDVILHIEKPITATPQPIILDWQQQKFSADTLITYLKQQPALVQLINIPNARWVNANDVLHCFKNHPENLTLAQSIASSTSAHKHRLSPANLKQLAASENYDVFCMFSAQQPEQCFDALLRHQSPHAPTYLGAPISQHDATTINWQNYATKPWQISCYKKIHDILHQHLLDKLPHYMVPSNFIIIDDIPLTANGKLNRKALADYEPVVITPYQAANTDIEQILIDIWQETLAINNIGVHDNFFQLGGHSLNALHVIHALKERWNISLDVVRLFEIPTIFELGQEIQKLLANQPAAQNKDMLSALVTLSKTGHKAPLFIIHPVGGTVFCYIPLAEALSIDHPIIGIQDPGITHPELLFHSLADMASHYIQLIKTKQPNGPYYLAGASLGGTLAVEMAGQLMKQGDQVNFIGLFDTWAAFTEEFNSRERLEKTLWRQYHFLKQRLSEHKIANPEPWLDLNYQRLQLLLQYQHSMMNQPIHLFKAQEIEPEYKDLDEPTNHWHRYVTQPVQVHSVPGNHETILVEPNVTVLAELLRQCLEKI